MSEETEKKERQPKKMRLGEVHIYQGFQLGNGVENMNTINPLHRKEHRNIRLYATNLFVEVHSVAYEKLEGVAIEVARSTFLVPYANVKYCRPWDEKAAKYTLEDHEK